MRQIQRDIVGALLISGDGQVLLGQNKPGGVYEGRWLVPGGGIHDGESKEQAVIRELREEVGIDITKGHIELLDFVQTGVTEKTLRDTGERVVVDMTFYNFKVTFDQPADDIRISLDDDLGEAEWFSPDKFTEMIFSPSVEMLLKHLGFIK
mgnify:CR=1 FL=1